MHVDTIHTAAVGAPVVVAFKGEALLLLPCPDVRHGLAAAPEVAQFGLLCDGSQLVAALPATDLASLSDGAAERLGADGASDFDLSRATLPSGTKVAIGRAVDRLIGLVGRFLEERPTAMQALPLLTSVTAGRAVAERLERLATDGASLGLIHDATITYRITNGYTQMATDRIVDDAPLLNTMWPPSNDPADERMADLFAPLAAD